MDRREFEAKVKKWIDEQKMFEMGDTCIVGVSGGADSICLLTVLAHLQRELAVRLLAVHVHHGLRGADADADEGYVRDYCAGLSVPCEIYHFDVAALARESGQTLEEAGRSARYRAYEETAAKQHLTQYKIAVAHNKNDHAETVLFHMARGAGMMGMKGIPAKRGRIVRPLLQVERAEIEAYLFASDIAYRTDQTNLEDTYARNKIRLHVMDELERVNARAIDHITEFAEIASAYDRYVSGQVQAFLNHAATEACIGGRVVWKLALAALLAQDALIADLALLELISRTCGGGKDIGRTHVEEVKKLYGATSGSRIMLPHGAVVFKEYESLVFSAGEGKPRAAAWRIDVTAPGTYRLPDGGSLEIEKFEKPVHLDLTKKEYTKFADYDKIRNGVAIRFCRANDVMVINAEGGRKKISRLFSACKIPAAKRSQIPLVVSGEEVIWAVGVRLGENYKICDDTKNVLRMEYRPGTTED